MKLHIHPQTWTVAPLKLRISNHIPHFTVWVCDYLSMLELKLIYSKETQCILMACIGTSVRLPKCQAGNHEIKRWNWPVRRSANNDYVCGLYCRKTSNISRTLVGNKIVDHSDVVGASPVGAAPTTSSFSTWHLASRDSAKKVTRQYENLLSVGIWCVLYYRLDGKYNTVPTDQNNAFQIYVSDCDTES